MKEKKEKGNSSLDLYSVRTAAAKCKRRQVDFIKDYEDAGLPVAYINGRRYIREEDIRRYQDRFMYVKVKAS